MDTLGSGQGLEQALATPETAEGVACLSDCNDHDACLNLGWAQMAQETSDYVYQLYNDNTGEEWIDADDQGFGLPDDALDYLDDSYLLDTVSEPLPQSYPDCFGPSCGSLGDEFW